MTKQPQKPKKTSSTEAIAGIRKVPSQNIEILKNELGLDLTSSSPEKLQGLMAIITRSMSSCPYTSGEMLKEYIDCGFPEMPQKVIETIDRQILHRQSMERIRQSSSETRKLYSQISASLIGTIGILASLVAGYFHVSSSICITVAIVSVGGPGTATVTARLLDKYSK